MVAMAFVWAGEGDEKNGEIGRDIRKGD